MEWTRHCHGQTHKDEYTDRHAHHSTPSPTRRNNTSVVLSIRMRTIATRRLSSVVCACNVSVMLLLCPRSRTRPSTLLSRSRCSRPVGYDFGWAQGIRIMWDPLPTGYAQQACLPSIYSALFTRAAKMRSLASTTAATAVIQRLHAVVQYDSGVIYITVAVVYWSIVVVVAGGLQ